ncbi:MAG: SipW-dependent-type signal peptide-containing protein [Lachnospiraceae bacterium]|nr:SipW-dependent-type signal peptide-containing protein [Lachnospiraceae bacterium]
MRKKAKTAAAVSLCILSAAAGTTYSYLTSRDNVNNTFDAAKVETPIDEKFPDPGTIVPGSKVTKSPKLVNSGDVSCYARMKVEFTNDDIKNQCEPIEIHDGWSLEEDGYYYWRDAIPVGGSTASLFDYIKVSPDADMEDILPFDVLVYGESVNSLDRTAEEAWAEMDS